MRITWMMAGVAMGLCAWTGPAKADTMNDTKATVEHPVDAYHKHEVNADTKDTQEFSQQKAEAKARLDQAKMDYEKSLKDNGANSDVTKDAQKRMADARKEYRKYAHKTMKAKKELGEDTQKMMNDKTAP